MGLIDIKEIRQLIKEYQIEHAKKIIMENINNFINFLDKCSCDREELLQINDIVNAVYVALKNKDVIMLLDILEYEYVPFQNSFAMRDK